MSKRHGTSLSGRSGKRSLDENKMNYLDIDIRSIKNFRTENAKKVDIGNRLMRLSHYLRDTVLHIEFESFIQHLLVQNIHRSFQEALILAMRGEPAMCLAMIRIGVEGTRDLLRILESPDLTSLFVEGQTTKENRRKWREAFRFNEEKEASLLHLYNISSDFGVHSRMPLLDPIGVVKKDGEQNFVSVGQVKHAKVAFVLGLQAIELSNLRIMEEIKPLTACGSEEAKTCSVLWWRHYQETSVITEKYFKIFHKDGQS